MLDNIIEGMLDILLSPLEWAINKTLVFAVTAPMIYIYIAMGVSAFIAVVLIWSIIPKKAMSQNVQPIVFRPYESSEQDEAWASQVLAEAKAI